ncbi:hypothetical protein J2Y63_006941 [Shinella sp. BE166]
MSKGEGCLECRSIEVLVFTLGTLAGDVRKSLRPSVASFGTCRLNCFPVISLVLTSDGFEAGEIVAAIKNPEGGRINLGHRDMEVRPPFLDVSDDEARAISTDPELGVDRPDKCRQLCGRHRALGRNRKVADAITAAFHRCERMGIVQRLPISCEDVDTFVLGHLVQ